jgi:hypothetical protein
MPLGAAEDEEVAGAVAEEEAVLVAVEDLAEAAAAHPTRAMAAFAIRRGRLRGPRDLRTPGPHQDPIPGQAQERADSDPTADRPRDRQHLRISEVRTAQVKGHTAVHPVAAHTLARLRRIDH